MTVSGRKQSTTQVISNPPAPAARLEENGERVQAAHGLIMGGVGGGSEDEKGVERTEQRWRRRRYQEGGRGVVTAPTAIVQAVQ